MKDVGSSLVGKHHSIFCLISIARLFNLVKLLHGGIIGFFLWHIPSIGWFTYIHRLQIQDVEQVAYSWSTGGVWISQHTCLDPQRLSFFKNWSRSPNLDLCIWHFLLFYSTEVRLTKIIHKKSEASTQHLETRQQEKIMLRRPYSVLTRKPPINKERGTSHTPRHPLGITRALIRTSRFLASTSCACYRSRHPLRTAEQSSG
jgi:hypothetical protein